MRIGVSRRIGKLTTSLLTFTCSHVDNVEIHNVDIQPVHIKGMICLVYEQVLKTVKSHNCKTAFFLDMRVAVTLNWTECQVRIY